MPKVVREGREVHLAEAWMRAKMGSLTAGLDILTPSELVCLDLKFWGFLLNHIRSPKVTRIALNKWNKDIMLQLLV